jgi:putative transposase
MQKRRLQAAKLFDDGVSPAEVARRLKVSRQSATRWRQMFKANGKDALRSKGVAGRKPALDREQSRELAATLKKGPLAAGYRTDLWTLPRVAALIRGRFGVRYHSGHCWHLLRRMGFSCQMPERRALERDEKKIRRWTREEWPALKKKLGGSGAPSSSSMKAD